MNLKPLQDRIIIKRTVPDLVTSWGLVLIDTPSKHDNEGTVMALGQGRFNDNDDRVPLDVKVGDRVLYVDDDDLVKFKYKGTDYLTVREDKVIGVIE